MFMMKKVHIAVLFFVLSSSQLFAQAGKDPFTVKRNDKDQLGYFRQSRRYADIMRRGAFVVNLPEEERFLVFFIPSAEAVDKVMVLLHGTGGTAYDEVADEIDMAEKYGYALMGVQWLDKRKGSYDEARKINRIIDKGFRFLQKEFGSKLTRAALCGFSRGSAVSYEVAYLDKNARQYFDLIIAHSGGIPFDNVVAPGEGNRPGKFFSDLTSGQLGANCLSGISFYLYAGKKDEEWGSRMAEYMQYTAEVIRKNQGKVVRLIIDPDGRHAGYRLNKDYHEEAIRQFLSPSVSQEIDKSFFKSYTASFVIYDRSLGKTVKYAPELSARRLSPCSTFKIYNTLIGLELGLIRGADEPWYTWDGVYRDIDGWNKDLTLREAFRVSAVPAYQALARQIGSERMKQYLEQIDYGTKDISAGIDTFWLDSSAYAPILISADEQVGILNKLLDGELPFSKKNVAVLKDIMLAAKTDKGALYGKTGSGKSPEGKWALGWFVGFLEHNETIYVFACNIMGGEEPSGKAARAIVEDIFRSQGLL